MSIRFKIACINWGHPDAPHALSYVLIGSEMAGEAYHATWCEAVQRVEREVLLGRWTRLAERRGTW